MIAAADEFRDRTAVARVEWLLGRMEATIDQYQAQIRQLKTRLSEATISNKKMGAATTLSPRDAVKYLSPAELAAIIDPAAAQAMAQSQEAAQAAQQDRQEIQRRLSALTLAVEAVKDTLTVEQQNAFDRALADAAEPAAAERGSWAGPSEPPAAGLDDLFS